MILSHDIAASNNADIQELLVTQGRGYVAGVFGHGIARICTDVGSRYHCLQREAQLSSAKTLALDDCHEMINVIRVNRGHKGRLVT